MAYHMYRVCVCVLSVVSIKKTWFTLHIIQSKWNQLGVNLFIHWKLQAPSTAQGLLRISQVFYNQTGMFINTSHNNTKLVSAHMYTQQIHNSIPKKSRFDITLVYNITWSYTTQHNSGHCHFWHCLEKWTWCWKYNCFYSIIAWNCNARASWVLVEHISASYVNQGLFIAAILRLFQSCLQEDNWLILRGECRWVGLGEV